MTATNYRQLFEEADRKRTHSLEKALRDHGGMGDMSMWARALDSVNQHITVEPKIVETAAAAYNKLGQQLVNKLKWPSDAISVLPQGSSSTRTLISSPTTAKFDIDAVCSVDLSRIEAREPMDFFDEFEAAFEGHEIEEKNRCWRIHYTGEPFYIDFTPSVPLDKVPAAKRNQVKYSASTRYHETALAVVDRPSKNWKTSNPQGYAAWINDQAKRPVLRMRIAEDGIIAKRMDIAPVLEQAVPLSDTLRVAIRLFKRHRDMAVRRNLVTCDVAPISVIISTLLTQCYEGMADGQRQYDHPIELLVALAEAMPYMVEIRDGDFWIANPTVDGENFAERWNDDASRLEGFRLWCRLLVSDLFTILAADDPQTIQDRVQQVFGCTGASASQGPAKPLGLLAVTKPSSTPAVKPGRGLA